MKRVTFLVVIALVLVHCIKHKETKMAGTSFGDDIDFLKQYTEVVVLSDESGQAQVAVCPGMQGRVMTSTLAGSKGLSFGWINRAHIQSGENDTQINAFGGEDRFWLGPEGGQFSIFFKMDTPFDFEHWHTPVPINEGAFEVVGQDKDRISVRRSMSLVNYSDFKFDLEVEREIRLLATNEVEQALGTACPKGVKLVAYESNNKITNTGEEPWQKETGLLSIWILGMYVPSPVTTVVVPFISGPESELGRVVNDEYFGRIPNDRLIVSNGVMYFKGDGKYRSKLGVSKKRAKPILGSYDAGNGVLTLVQYTLPRDATDYVNSMWRLQTNPYGGDVVNSYNDGPIEPGKKPLGPFYELETSSPAAALGVGQSLTHVHRTIHLQGSEPDLEVVASAVLGVSIKQIKKAFQTK